MYLWFSWACLIIRWSGAPTGGDRECRSTDGALHALIGPGANRACVNMFVHDVCPRDNQEKGGQMKKILSVLVAALFAAVSVNALAAKHMAAEKGAKAEKKEMKKDEGKKAMKKGDGKKAEKK